MISTTSTTCPGCNREVDPDMCYCGDYMSDGCHEGHMPTALGCTCGHSTIERLEISLFGYKLDWDPGEFVSICSDPVHTCTPPSRLTQLSIKRSAILVKDIPDRFVEYVSLKAPNGEIIDSFWAQITVVDDP